MRLPSLTALTMFEATARLGSFARAAEELCISESAVFKQVVALEDRMGVALFQRTKKRLVLTTEGAQYAAEVRDCIKALAASTEGMLSRARGKEVVEVAAVPAFATQWLIPRTRDFLALHQDVALTVFSRVDPLDLAGSKFNVVVYSGRSPMEGHPSCRIVGEGDSVAVCSPRLASVLERGEYEALLQTGLLHLESRPHAWQALLSAHGLSRHEALLGHRFELFYMVIQAAVAGLGVALVPRIMVEEQLRSGTLRELAWLAPQASADAGSEPVTYYASWKSNCNAATKKFVAWLATLC